LVRAYTTAAQAAVQAAATEEFVQRQAVCVHLDYSHYQGVRSLLEDAGATQISEDFGSSVLISCLIPSARARAVIAGIGDLTAGRAKVSAG
jgi:putative IMPACT (imprinted ancient) family translation regulator